MWERGDATLNDKQLFVNDIFNLSKPHIKPEKKKKKALRFPREKNKTKTVVFTSKTLQAVSNVHSVFHWSACNAVCTKSTQFKMLGRVYLHCKERERKNTLVFVVVVVFFCRVFAF